MLSILCSRIQDYMLSLMNEVDLWLLLLLCVLYEMQNQIFQHHEPTSTLHHHQSLIPTTMTTLHHHHQPNPQYNNKHSETHPLQSTWQPPPPLPSTTSIITIPTINNTNTTHTQITQPYQDQNNSQSKPITKNQLIYPSLPMIKSNYTNSRPCRSRCRNNHAPTNH